LPQSRNSSCCSCFGSRSSSHTLTAAGSGAVAMLASRLV
jgi:hypothetical protein